MIEKEVTTNEIFEFLQEHMVMKADMKSYPTKDDLDFSIDKLREELTVEIRKSEHRILDLVDNKLDDLKGDLVVMLRKEDHKLVALIEVLAKKNVLNKQETENLLQLQPFPQT